MYNPSFLPDVDYIFHYLTFLNKFKKKRVIYFTYFNISHIQEPFFFVFLFLLLIRSTTEIIPHTNKYCSIPKKIFTERNTIKNTLRKKSFFISSVKKNFLKILFSFLVYKWYIPHRIFFIYLNVYRHLSLKHDEKKKTPKVFFLQEMKIYLLIFLLRIKI